VFFQTEMRNVITITVLLLLSSTGVLANNPDAASNFKITGFGMMAFVFGIIFVFTAMYQGAKAGGGQILQQKLFLFCNIINTLSAVFLVFGPGASGGGPATNIFGVQMFFLVSLGYYYMLTDNANTRLAYFIFGLWQLAGFFGILDKIFGMGPSIENVSNLSCLMYFGKTSDPDWNRCEDDGFLQFLRVWSFWTIYTLATTIAVVFYQFPSSNLTLSRKNSGSYPHGFGGEGGNKDALIPNKEEGGLSDNSQSGGSIAGYNSLPAATS